MSAIAPSAATVHYREAFARLQPVLDGAATRRAAAMERFAELGFPGEREEAWKYTSLRRLESRRFVPATAPATPVDVPDAFVAQRLVLANGSPVGHIPASLGGFALGTLTAASEEQLLRALPGGGTERFAALNAALTSGPLLLSTQAGQQGDDVLQLTLVTTGAGPTLASPRIAVRMAAGSRARLLIDHVDDGAHEHFTNAVLDIELGAGAHFTLYRLQRQSARAFHIERIETRVGENATFVMRDSQLGAALARLDTNVSLDGRSAATEITGVFLADGTRHLDSHIHVDHRAIGTTSLQDYRGIAANKGRGVFNGKAIVHAGAQKSNARQVNRNLLLTPGAEIDTKPDLEIYADDVQCSHGTTTGQLDPDALFYLRSRGLSEPEARSALTRAFAGAVLTRVDEPALARHVHDELDRRLVRLLEVVA
ncbi:MAG: Fe-S cluster assembly protein SufD [Gammaproteobacteria bacterium]|nr:Fe-S cluster assembly protein SufD [Gammaproteobacteria bacterium]MDH4313190.1 Fe-S cluster assembly protein SufD [Gammaproteobacteria bacterium]MDH5272512.1 Fe-S cluster assembly protein SufD [Gammaproteobacteria bacterium]